MMEASTRKGLRSARSFEGKAQAHARPAPESAMLRSVRGNGTTERPDKGAKRSKNLTTLADKIKLTEE